MTLDLSRRFLLLYFFVQTTAIQIGEMRVNLYRGTHDSIRKLVEIAMGYHIKWCQTSSCLENWKIAPSRFKLEFAILKYIIHFNPNCFMCPGIKSITIVFTYGIAEWLKELPSEMEVITWPLR